jgi:hypothetical protein
MAQDDSWARAVGAFLRGLVCGDGMPSVPGGAVTLYGTCYCFLALHYLGITDRELGHTVARFVAACQSPESGLFAGPELEGLEPKPGSRHDLDHLRMHTTCSAALPVSRALGLDIRPITAAHGFCNLDRLRRWLDRRSMEDAWFEGNNLLFVGQLLVHLRDVERNPAAGEALELWFEWLDRQAHPATGLWGTDQGCSAMEAVYGGYHQLLVYHHEDRPLPNRRGTVDTVLSLQHPDGGFNPGGNGGACEDVDSVDILVNCYKRLDYRRTEVRHALRRCLRHILATQNDDGGFPYNRDQPQSHMGVPGTEAPANVSCTFPTWFRIHTLALIAEVLPHEAVLRGTRFGFNPSLSMGWHASPPGWVPPDDRVTLGERLLRARDRLDFDALKMSRAVRTVAGRAKRRLKRRRP